MGRIRHSTIVVTSGFKENAELARLKAISMGLVTSRIIGTTYNDYWSFFITPDGSKEGWGPSNDFESARYEWICWAAKAEFDKPPVYLDWVYLDFGGDDEGAVIRDHSESDKHDPQPSSR